MARTRASSPVPSPASSPASSAVSPAATEPTPLLESTDVPSAAPPTAAAKRGGPRKHPESAPRQTPAPAAKSPKTKAPTTTSSKTKAPGSRPRPGKIAPPNGGPPPGGQGGNGGGGGSANGHHPIWSAQEEQTLTLIDHAFRRTKLKRLRSYERLEQRLADLFAELERLSEDFMLEPSMSLLTERGLAWFTELADIVGEFVERRLRGQYPTDEFGFDRDLAVLLKPFFEFMFETWWRIEVRGIEHIPSTERVLLIANHSGLFCWDAFMIKRALRKVIPHRKPVRGLINPNYFRFPYVGGMMTSMGMSPSFPENCRDYLRKDQAVVCFPGGDNALARDLTDPYRVASFENCGYIEEALRCEAAIVPVAVVGGHESYPILFRLDAIGRMFGLPMLPVTPFFPFAHPLLWLVPLPVKWMISFLPSVPAQIFSSSEEIDSSLVMMHEENLRTLITEELELLLQERHGIFG